jgi:superfamily II DNA or RNA helicase
VADIKLTKLNSATVFVSSSPRILRELNTFFRARSGNYRFNPKYKAGFWDGYIDVFSTSTQHLPIGLVNELESFAKRGKYTVEKDYVQTHDFSIEKFKKFVDVLHIEYRDERGQIIPNAKPRPYQMASAYDSITRMHHNVEVPTSGGKTCISYIIARYMHAREKKMLLIVPTTTLVEQTYSDWFDFGWNRVRDCCHRIHGDHEKYFGSPVTISTWQSLYKDQQVFHQFDCLMIDEAHGAAANSLQNIARWCDSAEWRLGMSGTYPEKKKDDEKLDYFNIVGATGPIHRYVTYKEMEDAGWIPKIEIIGIKLKYQLPIRRQFAVEIGELKREFRTAKETGVYCPNPLDVESDMIHSMEQRNEFIAKLIEKSCKGNTMVLFRKKEKHGYLIRDYLTEYFKGQKKIIYIDGDIDTDVRNTMRHHIDRNEDIILLASYGTFSTGISIKNIHNLIMASGYKAKIKILQSIGRALRKMKNKEKVRIYDIVDDMTIKLKDQPQYKTYSSKHWEEREGIYKDKKLNYKVITYKF